MVKGFRNLLFALFAVRAILAAGDSGDDDDAYEEYYNVIVPNAPAGYKYIYEKKMAYPYGVENEGFGKSVSVCGNRVLVGAYEDSNKGEKAGAAHILLLDDSQMGWRYGAFLVSNETAAYDYFGWSVGLAENFAVVGAWQSDMTGSNAGAAYVFEKTSDYFVSGKEEWIVHSKLYGWEHDDSFGIIVAISDNGVIAIGAPGGSSADGQYGAGYVSIFRYVGNEWHETDVIEASDPHSNHYFGMTLSLDMRNSRVAVGAYGHVMSGSTRVGMVYLFDLNTWGSPFEMQKIRAHDPAANDEFGRSVTLLDDLLVVGSPGDDDAGESSGSVYIFERGSNGFWAQVQKLSPTSTCEYCYFGVETAMINTTLVVSFHAGSSFPGTVQVYKGTAIAASPFEYLFSLNASDSSEGDQFGAGLAIDAYNLVIGAPTSNGYDFSSGAVYVYSTSGDYTAETESESSGSTSMLIASVAAALVAAGFAAAVYFWYSSYAKTYDGVKSGSDIDSSVNSRRGLTDEP